MGFLMQTKQAYKEHYSHESLSSKRFNSVIMKVPHGIRSGVDSLREEYPVSNHSYLSKKEFEEMSVNGFTHHLILFDVQGEFLSIHTIQTEQELLSTEQSAYMLMYNVDTSALLLITDEFEQEQGYEHDCWEGQDEQDIEYSMMDELSESMSEPDNDFDNF